MPVFFLTLNVFKCIFFEIHSLGPGMRQDRLTMGHGRAVPVHLLEQCQPMALTQPGLDDSVTHHRPQVLVLPLWAVTALCLHHRKGKNEFSICTIGVSGSSWLSHTAGFCVRCSNRNWMGKHILAPAAHPACPSPSRFSTFAAQAASMLQCGLCGSSEGCICQCTFFPTVSALAFVKA